MIIECLDGSLVNCEAAICMSREGVRGVILIKIAIPP